METAFTVTNYIALLAVASLLLAVLPAHIYLWIKAENVRDSAAYKVTILQSIIAIGVFAILFIITWSETIWNM